MNKAIGPQPKKLLFSCQAAKTQSNSLKIIHLVQVLNLLLNGCQRHSVRFHFHSHVYRLSLTYRFLCALAAWRERKKWLIADR
jgi:hypothetical protein